MLKNCYENYASNAYVSEFIRRMTAALEENNDMHELRDNYDFVDLIEISPLMNMMLSILMAMMPILMMLMETNLI